ncbi:putrescine transporter subunit: periplasmic-binding component of ABC superfamily [uncultured Defluviicoccus sp.]|uniref:Putrescine transporter subunit: periplasmic-binding component of ABC superfamily n=1 Tax=metagenome TaxID=256318 RepID=A0A380TIP2_9ZZZZ|nr:putrescine transporter subunit: periplasmic-binding component of ABC superfamily [uncultured Defluviicoccus sp.]
MAKWVRLLLGLALVMVLASPLFAKEQVVRVYNWSDYIDETVLDDFTRETGIKVVYDVYDSNEILETKLLTGKSGYDVVFPSGNFLARQIKAGVFQKLDRAQLPNWKNLDPQIMKRVEGYDPGNLYGVVYMWGTTGIAYNDKLVKARMADAPVNSWSLVFDPAIIKTFADCGIFMLDAPDEMVPAVLNILGENPDSKDPKVLAKAEPVLMGVRPYVRKFHSSETINAIANGDICLAVMWSGDAGIAASRAEEAGKDFKVHFSIPKEGAQMWFDLMAIPKDAPNSQAAHAFINFLMRPEIIARASNVVTYANANAAAKPFMNKEIVDNPVVYPPPDVQAKLFVITPFDQASQRTLTRLWQKVKSGR